MSQDEKIRSLARQAGEGDLAAAEKLVAALRRRGTECGLLPGDVVSVSCHAALLGNVFIERAVIRAVDGTIVYLQGVEQHHSMLCCKLLARYTPPTRPSLMS